MRMRPDRRSIRTVLVLCALAGVILLFAGWGRDENLSQETSPAQIVPQSRMLEVGEELEYKVSYSFFNIGKIRIRVVDKEVRGGRTVYRTEAYIDSNPSLSWLVDLHIRYHSEMDGSVYSLGWLAEDSTKDGVNFKRFRFNYGEGVSLVDRGKRSAGNEWRVEAQDTVRITEHCQDGLSLYFYAREHVHEMKQHRIPTLIENKQVYTLINFTNRRTEADIDAVDYPVDVVEFDGTADYVGIFGLTGGFRGWFSNDSQQIPILARMNVILGSIKVQLERWHRPGWQPPKYVESPAK